MNIPEQLRFSRDHLWVAVDRDLVTVGLTEFAATLQGPILFVELPRTGASLVIGQSGGAVESAKCVSDLYCPVAGEVVAVNATLDQRPELVNDDPYGEGWVYRVRARALGPLMGAAEYHALLNGS